MISNGQPPSLEDVWTLLGSNGHRPVLLPIPAKQKRPSFPEWQNVQYAHTQAPVYQNKLRSSPNTGVLLGVKSDNLCTIDCDTQAFFEEFVDLNRRFAATLRTRGTRGQQIWAYVTGERPKKIYHLKVRADSLLAVGGKNPGDDGLVSIGEFRAEGGQSVIRGIHPEGMEYILSCAKPPIEIPFAEILWPADIELPWIEAPNPTPAANRLSSDRNEPDSADLLRRAIQKLTVSFLWDHSGYPKRRFNPTRSPFRPDKHPSFSIYDEGRRWKDHGTGQYGDSFDFYQLATGHDARSAFVEFIKLAGLGAELKINKRLTNSKNSPTTIEPPKLPPPSGASEQASERDADSPFGGVETPQEEYRNPQAGEKFSKDAANQAAKPELILPSGSVSFTQCAQAAFPVLAKRQRFFSRDRTLVEIAYNKLLKDAQRHDVFQLLEADAFRSRLEADFHLWVWREQNGKNILKPGRCTNDAARVLLKSDEALEYLPAITFISARPVYTLVGGELKILYRGYHDIHGGIFVSHGDPAQPIPIPKLSEAVSLLLDVLKDYDFVTPSDKARALAFFISPALRTGKFLGDADFPIDVAEANESQGGKTYRLKLVCALYGEIPYVIANRKGGVGSLDESISSALVAGVPFILFDNYRGRMDSQILETSLRGIGKVGVRVPHRGEIQVSTTHVNWQLSSNGIEGTRDFVNRSIINRICKRPKGYQFASYREGDILAHIKANQSQYLGAVFAIIKEWITQGCPRTNENRHDFTEWASSVDWIVQNIFALPPLLEGHTEEVLRVSDPALSWLRALAIAVNKDNRLDVDLSTSDIVEICQGTAIDFPNNKIAFSNIDQISMYTGRLLTRLFHDLSATDCLRVDRYKVEHSTVIQPRQDRSGEFSKHFYRFTRRS